MNVVLVIASGYVVGSVPFAYLVTRRRGLDLREIGSGNVGAANVLRTSGVALAAMVMLLDMLKGSLAAAIVLAIAASMTKAPSVVVAAAVCAAALVVYRHRSNLARLVAGTER